MTDTPDILKKIVNEKIRDIELRKLAVTEDQLRDRLDRDTRGFVQAIMTKVDNKEAAVIAEVKKASPSKGVIREHFDAQLIAAEYQKVGATCISILTDEKFFQGQDQYLVDVRKVVKLPVLRKDFIVDAYQIFESRCLGADCILLIVSILKDDELSRFFELAGSLNMDVLIEVHDQQELARAMNLKPALLGINNRNLRTFDVSLQTTLDLLEQIPSEVCVVTESGIHSREDVQMMTDNGVYCFLVGESLMREADIGKKYRAMFG